jgi:wyosine [tRNA(Phe)-imidazoG37] synthetase (radical SAM superfamily)
LGLDLAPPKTCTLDCLYCEVGRTTHKTLDRFNLNMAKGLSDELAATLPEVEHRLDVITLAGSGEPTLNAEIGDIIRGVKQITNVRLCVLTNGTLLFQEDVRRDLAEADLVIPSLDTAVEKTFQRLNRPHPDLDLTTIINGLELFRREFTGEFRLEVLVSAGINDTPDELAALKRVIDRLQPDEIQLNTVYRLPAHEGAEAVSDDDLDRIARFLGPSAEPVGSFRGNGKASEHKNLSADVLKLLQRRPCTLGDVVAALGLKAELAENALDDLIKNGLIQTAVHGDQSFFHARTEGGEGADSQFPEIKEKS